MKVVFFFSCLFLLPFTMMSQTNKMLELPKREEINRIEISRGIINWYKSEELLNIVSNFVSTEERYQEREVFQYGKFILKNGKIINWMAANSSSIKIYDDSRERFYKLNNKPDNKAQTQNDETLFRIWDKTGKEGYINVSGQIVIRPQFDTVTEFSEGLAAVLIGDKWGYINRKGKIVIQPRWKPNDRYISAANPFKEGLALVVEYAHWHEDGDSYFCGYIDKTGKYVIQPQLRRNCRPFSEGLAWIVTNVRNVGSVDNDLNWGGYIDKKGKWAINPELYQGSDFKNGIAEVRKYSYPAQKGYLIDKTGRKVSGIKNEIPLTGTENIAASQNVLTLKMLKLRTISERPDFRNIYGYMNKQGKYVWLSPDAENFLDKSWIRENYIGKELP